MNDTTPPSHLIITIGRSFGAGGREVGLEIARRLGIKYYDKELLDEAASRAGLHAGLFEKNDERAPGFFSGLLPVSMHYNALPWYGTVTSAPGGDAVYCAQCEFINHIADTGPCVIVGRTADYILRKHPRLVSVFLHAPESVCVRRIVERSQDISPSRARSILRRTNRLRSAFYNFYTGRQWGNSASYDLTLDSSKLTISQLADIIISYVNARDNDRHTP